MGLPKLVTGHLSPAAQLVDAGSRRGMRYEIYFDPQPASSTRRPLSRRTPYASVIYGDLGGVVEVEQLGWSATIPTAIAKADRGIQRLWQWNMGTRRVRRASDAMEMSAACPCENENPLGPTAKKALWVGGAALAVVAMYSIWKTSQGNVPATPGQTFVTLVPGIQTTKGGDGTVYAELPPGARWSSQNGQSRAGNQPIPLTNFNLANQAIPSPPQTFFWFDAQNALQTTVLNITV